MKIALFCDTYIPVKNWLVSMVSHIKSSLESAEHEVYLFCPDYPNYVDIERNVIRIKSVWTPLKLDDRVPLTLRKRKEIKQFLMDNEIDIIHSHSEFVLWRLAKKLAKQCDIKYIHTFHTMWEDYSHYLMVPKISIRKAVAHFLKNVDHITSPSIKSCKYLEETLKRVWRVSSEKRVFELVKAYDKLIFPKDVDIKLMIIGDGKQFKKVKKYIDSSTYKENYILTWYVDWEEAVFLWLPCVVVKDDSFKWLVTDWKNGYIWEDIQDYSKKILSLSRDKQTRKSFKKANKEVAEKYISENIIKKYIQLYEI